MSAAGRHIAYGCGQGLCLFIEDDHFIADMYRIRLESDGWQVDVAADGEAGLRQALADPPALVLLDILLPRLDGIEVLRGLRESESTRDVPVLIVRAR